MGRCQDQCEYTVRSLVVPSGAQATNPGQKEQMPLRFLKQQFLC